MCRHGRYSLQPGCMDIVCQTRETTPPEAGTHPALSSVCRNLQIEGFAEVAHDEPCPFAMRALTQHAGNGGQCHGQRRTVTQRAQHAQRVQVGVCARQVCVVYTCLHTCLHTTCLHVCHVNIHAHMQVHTRMGFHPHTQSAQHTTTTTALPTHLEPSAADTPAPSEAPPPPQEPAACP